MENHYEVLGVSSDADLDEVRAAYRRLIKEHHPDHGGSRERFLRIKEAYEQVTGERAPGQGETDGGGAARPDPTYDPASRDAGEDYGLTVDGEYLRLTLVGLVQDVELSDILAGPTVNSDARRTVAFFAVRNESDRVLTWQGRRHATFVGDDGFMYESSSIVTPHDDRLPNGWCGTDVTLAPGRAVDAVVIAEAVPDDVAIRRIVYTQHVREFADETVSDTERYLFSVSPAVKRHLGEMPLESE